MKTSFIILASVLLAITADAQNVGIGTPTPNSSAILELKDTTRGLLPPRMSQPQRDLITPVEGLIVYNTTTKKPNYYDGTIWRNYDGTSAKTLGIGDAYLGGIIAYILLNGDPGYDAVVQHGLIAAPSDQSTGIYWWSNAVVITTGATASALGTGNANTNTIVAAIGAGNYAAQVCYDLVFGGYSDWYLPSSVELNKLYLNRVAIGGFTTNYYWSSTEINGTFAEFQYFLTGQQLTNSKSYGGGYVRAIRTF